MSSSQEQLAIRAGTTQSAIARIERDRTSPSIETMRALFQAMEEDFVFDVSGPRLAVST